MIDHTIKALAQNAGYEIDKLTRFTGKTRTNEDGTIDGLYYNVLCIADKGRYERWYRLDSTMPL